MVAPAGDWSNVTTRACFEPVSCDLDDFEALDSFAIDLGERFFADFGIGNPVRLIAASRAAPPKPHHGQYAGGARSRCAVAVEDRSSTAPMAI